MSRPSASAQRSFLAHARKAEQNVSSATSQREALDAAIDAAENYMKALKLATDTTDKHKLDAKCRELLTRAEEIKNKKTWQPQGLYRAAAAACTRPPVSKRRLTTREEIILLEGSKLNGFVFRPWTTAPEAAEFEKGEEKGLFLDTPDLHLSDKQRQIFAGWQRPRDLLYQRNSECSDSIEPMMSVSGQTDLVQDVLTDCSVVASLCATTSKTERGCDEAFLPLVYPYDGSTGKPQLSSSGKYIFMFYFNGCFRRVVVDDRLPSSNTARSLYMIDRNHANFLWPALVEKAYLKVRGGYDFPGSNSGTDLWVLTGWIPEQIFLHGGDVTVDEIWRRLFDSFHDGNVMLTIGTGCLTDREQTALGLVSEHDYAILDLRESNGRRQMLLKNPWAGAEIAQSVISSGSNDASSALSPGSFWMDCSHALQHFENLYLNWNPGLFRYREDIHFTWNLEEERSTAGCFVKNPQFSISAGRGGTVWMLLGKHFRTSPDRSLESDALGFISIYIFDANGQRVYLSDGALHRGPYVDAPNTLMRLDMPPHTTYTAVVSEQSLPSCSQNFTLSTLSVAPVTLAPTLDQYTCVTRAQGAWVCSTAGGNAESARYASNPQFRLEVSDMTDVSILLETSEADLATHVKLFWSDGKRIARVRSRDIIADSGDYRRGCALAEAKGLSAGSYTIVCSTFAPDQLGRFALRVATKTRCSLKPLAAESAGRRVILSPIGILPPGQDRMLAPLAVPRLTRLKLIARSTSSLIGSRSVAASPMLMTVELGQGPYKEVLASSEDGTHSDTVSGIRIDDIDIQPGLEDKGGVWVVIERVGGPGGQVEDRLQVELLAEERVEIGEWILEDA